MCVTAISIFVIFISDIVHLKHHTASVQDFLCIYLVLGVMRCKCLIQWNGEVLYNVSYILYYDEIFTNKIQNVTASHLSYFD